MPALEGIYLDSYIGYRLDLTSIPNTSIPEMTSTIQPSIALDSLHGYQLLLNSYVGLVETT
jgi:hypothetical protein